jgi:hypothetical protein
MADIDAYLIEFINAQMTENDHQNDANLTKQNVPRVPLKTEDIDYDDDFSLCKPGLHNNNLKNKVVRSVFGRGPKGKLRGRKQKRVIIPDEIRRENFPDTEQGKKDYRRISQQYRVQQTRQRMHMKNKLYMKRTFELAKIIDKTYGATSSEIIAKQAETIAKQKAWLDEYDHIFSDDDH